MHPFAMQMAAILCTASIDFHSAPKWPLWWLPSCCYAVTSYANALLNSLHCRHGMDYSHDTYEDDALPNFETPSPDADKVAMGALWTGMDCGHGLDCGLWTGL